MLSPWRMGRILVGPDGLFHRDRVVLADPKDMDAKQPESLFDCSNVLAIFLVLGKPNRIPRILVSLANSSADLANATVKVGVSGARRLQRRTVLPRVPLDFHEPSAPSLPSSDIDTGIRLSRLYVEIIIPQIASNCPLDPNLPEQRQLMRLVAFGSLYCFGA